MPVGSVAAISMESIRAAVASADAAVFRAINAGLSAHWLNPIMLVFAAYGLGVVQTGLNLCLILFGLIKERINIRRMGYAGLLAYGASGILNQVLKHIMDRPRPLLVMFDVHLVGDPLFTFSFPSGHATTAFAAAVAWGVFWPRARYALLALAFATAVSRVYLGVHFPLDTICGGALGALVGIAAAKTFHPIAPANSNQKEQAANTAD